MLKEARLEAGAGKARIVLKEELFPLEQFTGEHDPVYIRAVILRREKTVIIVSIEIPSVRIQAVMEKLQSIIIEETGAKAEDIWICTTHNLSTLHIPNPETMPEKHEIFVGELYKACKAAVQAAKGEMRDAQLGCVVTKLFINTSRDILTNQGWWNGLNGESVEDHELTVLKLEDKKGQPIAVLIQYPMKPWAANGAVDENGNRLSTSELSGYACRKVEKELGGTAVYFMGSAADMVPLKSACYSETDENGNLRDVNLGVEAGLHFIAEAGEALGTAVIDALSGISVKEDIFFASEKKRFWYSGQKFYYEGRPYRPTPDHVYYPAEEECLDVNLLCLDKCVLLGMAPETTAVLGIKLRESKSQVRALMCSLVNGGKDYLADELSYERKTFSATHSVFAKGAGEQFVKDAGKWIDVIYTCEK